MEQPLTARQLVKILVVIFVAVGVVLAVRQKQADDRSYRDAMCSHQHVAMLTGMPLTAPYDPTCP